MNEPFLGKFTGRRKTAKRSLVRCRRYRYRQTVSRQRSGRLCSGGRGCGRRRTAAKTVKGRFQGDRHGAGPFWNTERDWVSDERARTTFTGTIFASQADNTRWHLARITAVKAWVGVLCTGRHSLHACTLQTSAFYSQDGVGVDWPISYDELLPYYDLLEREIPVAGPAYFPWGHPHGYPFGPHPLGGVGNVLVRGLHEGRHRSGSGWTGSDFIGIARQTGHIAFIADFAFKAARSARRQARW